MSAEARTHTERFACCDECEDELYEWRQEYGYSPEWQAEYRERVGIFAFEEQWPWKSVDWAIASHNRKYHPEAGGHTEGDE